MQILGRALAIATLLSCSTLVFGGTGAETNATVMVKVDTVGFEHVGAWVSIRRRDGWDAEGSHYTEHWQGEVGDTTKSDLVEYGVGYRYITDSELVEHRPHIFITPQFTALDAKLKITARNKLEYRIREDDNDGFRYRLKPNVSYQININDGVTVSPYIGDEITYDMIDGDWGNNKVETGVDLTINNKYTITPYYEFEHDIPTGVKDESKFGISGTISF